MLAELGLGGLSLVGCREAILGGSPGPRGRGPALTGSCRGCGAVSPRFPEEPREGGRRSDGMQGMLPAAGPAPVPPRRRKGAGPRFRGSRGSGGAASVSRGRGRAAPWARPAAGTRSGCAAEGEPGGTGARTGARTGDGGGSYRGGPPVR